MSQRAQDFITPLSFEALSQNEVLTADNECWHNDNNHIHIGQWADIGVIAPASANTINKLAQGIADNLLTSTLLAFAKPIVIAPSANTKMYENPTTQKSIKKLQDRGYTFCPPQSKRLVCGDRGVGALADVADIFFKSARTVLSKPYFKDRVSIITGGGTIEAIDDVRYISNFSSGKMGYFLSLALYLRGAEVVFIQTKDFHSNCFRTVKVDSSQAMKRAIEEALSQSHPSPMVYLFMAAAVSDYIPKMTKKGSKKKSKLAILIL